MERITEEVVPHRDPSGQQEEIVWWFPLNGDPTVYVHDTKEQIVVRDIPQNGETNEAVLRRILAEIGKLSLSIRRNVSAHTTASDTMPQ
ncbi:MAG: hypothetical protein PHO20_05300 [Candidatus Peribacteraceae bacterium]|nr:hypothetical protein [Candidatus Peribacteraceae bacterium]MDD5740152.1 hypothetical protein [Candidatus Peribacteraceae bacterium]